jgi:hypothetical protein
MRPFWVGFTALLGVALAGTPATHADTVARDAPGRDVAIFLGGTDGFTSLANPSATQAYRATGRGGLYVHYNATDPVLFGPSLPAIAKTFAGTGGGVAELGLFHPGFFANEWQKHLVANGLSPKVALINVPFKLQAGVSSFDAKELATFKAFVDEARSVGGLQIIAPVLSPNSSGGKGAAGDAATLAVAHPWTDSSWDDLRAAALYGGGIALDAPPAFYLHGLPSPVQVHAYQVFAQAQLEWAAKNKITAFFIVSPFFDASSFLRDAQAEYDSIAAAGTLPTAWVIESYSACDAPYPRACTKADAAYKAPVGSETEADTEANVALWFARSAKVRPYTGTYAGAMAATK